MEQAAAESQTLAKRKLQFSIHRKPTCIVEVRCLKSMQSPMVKDAHLKAD